LKEAAVKAAGLGSKVLKQRLTEQEKQKGLVENGQKKAIEELELRRKAQEKAQANVKDLNNREMQMKGDEYKRQLADLQKINRTAQKRVSDSEGKVSEFEGRLKDLEERLEANKIQLAKNKANVTKLEQEARDNQSNLANATKEVQQLKTQLVEQKKALLLVFQEKYEVWGEDNMETLKKLGNEIKSKTTITSKRRKIQDALKGLVAEFDELVEDHAELEELGEDPNFADNIEVTRELFRTRIFLRNRAKLMETIIRKLNREMQLGGFNENKEAETEGALQQRVGGDFLDNYEYLKTSVGDFWLQARNTDEKLLKQAEKAHKAAKKKLLKEANKAHAGAKKEEDKQRKKHSSSTSSGDYETAEEDRPIYNMNKRRLEENK
jgi:hypothetical protein